ncbi:thiolase family protein [uncultured Desulfosarcina sp.]|uniref:thiolase family protein n=1 Tax=uncultured Desulfosarcina sp. TaxID=218289 RepID=UPI0029C90812|nr:thiolase family protein [uncultured Desulfosarcina sp.]
MQKEVLLIDGVRTAFGRIGGTLKHINGSKLASIALKGLVKKTKILEKTQVDSVLLGSAAHCVQSSNPARWATLDAGLGHQTSASYIEMQCGSAIDAINHAASKILSGLADVVIAGGFESHSTRFAKFPMFTPPYKLIPPAAVKQQLSPFEDEQLGMGLTAEILAEMYAIDRERQDEFAFNSQMKCKAAMENGLLDKAIIPIEIPGDQKTPACLFNKDEHPRIDTTLAGLAKLPPAFKKNGTVTAGNASGLNDGAAFVLMMSSEKAAELNYEPSARWVTGADCGCDPKIMGIAPAYAIPIALKRANIKVRDLDVIECNEAFAVQNLAVAKELENQTGESVDPERWNPLGGAIAYGHPNGASGARICIFAMSELARTRGKYGLIGSCCGGGLGVVSILENLKR